MHPERKSTKDQSIRAQKRLLYYDNSNLVYGKVVFPTSIRMNQNMGLKELVSTIYKV